MIRFDDTDYGEIDLMKGLLAGMASGLLGAYLMEQFQSGLSAVSDAMPQSKMRAGRKPAPATVRAANVISEKVIGRKLPRDYKSVAGGALDYGMGGGSGGGDGVT